MQFKHKLIYFALGCAFVVIGQVLLSVVIPKVTAQGKKEAVEFEKVKVRSLEVVDDSGKVRVKLTAAGKDALISLSGEHAQISISKGYGFFPSVTMANGDEGGLIGVSQHKKSSLKSFDTETLKKEALKTARTVIKITENGGIVATSGNDGKTRGALGVNKYGHGVVQTWDKNGAISEILGGISSSKGTSSSSTSQKEEFKDVKLFPYYTSKDFVEIGRGYAVRNLQFQSPYSDTTRVIGEVRIPAYIGTSPMRIAFSISLFDALGKYLGGNRFDIYDVSPKGGIFPFRVAVFDISGKVEYCHIRPESAWKPKED